MAHNGRRSQINFGFLETSRDVFLNYFKAAQNWSLHDDSGLPAPDTLNANGYPISISNGGLYTLTSVPDLSYRPGNYVLGWVGGATWGRRNFSHNILSGSATNLSGGVHTGSNGRAVLELTGVTTPRLSLDIGITAIDASAPITDAWLVHEDDEEDFLGGEIWNAKFLERAAIFGVFRFLDWQFANTSTVTTWSQDRPVGAFSYVQHLCTADMYKGATTNSGDDYSLAATGFTLVDKATVCCRVNANASGTSPTLNVNSTGAKTITSLGSTPSTTLASGRYMTCIYDEEMDVWSRSGGAISHAPGLLSGVPVSLMVDLCNRLGAHPWFHISHWSVDYPDDFAANLATYCLNNLDAGLVPRFEVSNEIWNPFTGFDGTILAGNKATTRWGGGASFQDWYGRAVSLCGEAISDVYSDDRSRYWMIVSVQSVAAENGVPGQASGYHSRVAGMHVTVDGGTPASDWATHVAMANYYGPTLTATQELQLAYDYDNAADEAEEAALLAEYMESALVDATRASLPYVLNLAVNWKAYSEGRGIDGLTFYEGGWSPDFLGSNNTGTISGASKAAQCVLTIATSPKPPVGSSVSIASVVGMTELNGNTYEVVSVVGNSVTIDVDSTGFTNYTSGGTATYVNSMTLRNTLRDASKDRTELYSFTRRMYSGLLVRGGVYPSHLVLAGANSAWSVLDPHIYVTDETAQWEAMVDFSNTATPIRFTLTLS